MLILASASDKLQIVTAAACNLSVHASYLDNVSGTVQPGRQNTAITIATTTDVVLPPAGGVFRNLKTLHVYNNSTTAAASVTVQHTDGTTIVQLHKVTLNTGATLQYIDEVGFLIANAQFSGSRVLIQQQVVTTPVPSLQFVTGIGTTYDQYEFRIYDVQFAGAPNWLYLRVSTDAGVTWRQEAGSYQCQFVFSAPPGPLSSINAVANMMQLIPQMPGASETGRLGNMINFQFAEPTNANIRHMFMGDSVVIQEAQGICRMSWVGEYGGPSGVGGAGLPFNGIQFLPFNAANLIAGTFVFYGIVK